jgi:hypothetical protein
LFQTSFLPLFTQVNFFPAATAVAPSFLQLSPDLTAEYPLIVEITRKKAINADKPTRDFIRGF